MECNAMEWGDQMRVEGIVWGNRDYGDIIYSWNEINHKHNIMIQTCVEIFLDLKSYPWLYRMSIRSFIHSHRVFFVIPSQSLYSAHISKCMHSMMMWYHPYHTPSCTGARRTSPLQTFRRSTKTQGRHRNLHQPAQIQTRRIPQRKEDRSRKYNRSHWILQPCPEDEWKFQSQGW